MTIQTKSTIRRRVNRARPSGFPVRFVAVDLRRINWFDLKVRPKRMSQEALQRIANYTFPGNIRELRNLLERAHILGRREEIAADDLPVDDRGHTSPGPHNIEMRDWLRTLPASIDLRELLTTFEKGLIERALEQANGVQAEAARMLGVSRSDTRIQSRKVCDRATNRCHVGNGIPDILFTTIRRIEASGGIPCGVPVTSRCAQDHIGLVHSGEDN